MCSRPPVFYVVKMRSFTTPPGFQDLLSYRYPMFRLSAYWEQRIRHKKITDINHIFFRLLISYQEVNRPKFLNGCTCLGILYFGAQITISANSYYKIWGICSWGLTWSAVAGCCSIWTRTLPSAWRISRSLFLTRPTGKEYAHTYQARMDGFGSVFFTD